MEYKPRSWEGGGELQCPQRCGFNPSAIGWKRYHAVVASVSRTLKRLKERGLITIDRHPGHYGRLWVELTESGIDAAITLYLADRREKAIG
jgi:hypothetical protein